MGVRGYVPGDYPNRTMCAALDEMRACFKSLNFSPIPGLIEEVQSMGNRMEAGLAELKDIEDLRALKKELRAEVRELQSKKKKAKK